MSPLRSRLPTLVALLVLLLAHPLRAADEEGERIHVGVLAYRGAEMARAQWQPVVNAWQEQMPGVSFDLVPLTLEGMETALLQRRISVILTNPGHFVALEQSFDLAAIATRVVFAPGAPAGLTRFGSAVVVRAESDINYLRDLRGRRVAAVSSEAFGGFMLAWEAMREQEIEPFEDLDELVFTGFPQDAIIEAVLAGEVDAGIVRTGLIENLIAEGRLKAGALRVLQPRAIEGFPFETTTRLYPEWPLAVAPWLGQQHAEALLRASLAAGRQGGIAWTAASSYEPVRRLLASYHAARAKGGGGHEQGALPWLAGGALLLAALLVAFALFRASAQRGSETGGTETAEARAARRRLEGLSMREREVLALVAEGRSSKEVAASLGIAIKTVEFHRGNILKKTGARSAAELARLATLAGVARRDSEAG